MSIIGLLKPISGLHTSQKCTLCLALTFLRSVTMWSRRNFLNVLSWHLRRSKNNWSKSVRANKSLWRSRTSARQSDILISCVEQFTYFQIDYLRYHSKFFRLHAKRVDLILNGLLWLSIVHIHIINKCTKKWMVTRLPTSI